MYSKLKSAIGNRVNASRLRYAKDINYLVAYPKSGITWLTFLIGNYISDKSINFSNVHDIVPDIHYNLYRIFELNPPRFIKTHELYNPCYKKVIYLVRDGRDVIVSFYHHNINKRIISSDISLSQYLHEYNNRTEKGIPSWGSHVLSWTKQKDEDILIIKYENMLETPLEVLKTVILFTGLSTDIERLKMSIDNSSLHRMRRMEIDKDFNGVDEIDENLLFVRKGEMNQWVEYMHLEEMQRFQSLNEEPLSDLGYI